MSSTLQGHRRVGGEGAQVYALFGVRCAPLSRAQVLAYCARILASDDAHDQCVHIATLNPDFFLQARTDEAFRRVLNAADGAIIDGVGVRFIGMLLGWKVQRYSGADFVRDALAAAHRYGWRVHVLCRADGLSRWADVRRVLRRQYPHARVTGADVAVPERGDYADIARTVARACSEPTLVLCAFGAPAQEHCVSALRAHGVRGIAVGVGGALDFLTGAVARAPLWMRRMGIEWLWRTARQPKRIGKMLRSVVVFPVRALLAIVREKCRWSCRGGV